MNEITRGGVFYRYNSPEVVDGYDHCHSLEALLSESYFNPVGFEIFPEELSQKEQEFIAKILKVSLKELEDSK